MKVGVGNTGLEIGLDRVDLVVVGLDVGDGAGTNCSASIACGGCTATWFEYACFEALVMRANSCVRSRIGDNCVANNKGTPSTLLLVFVDLSFLGVRLFFFLLFFLPSRLFNFSSRRETKSILMIDHLE